MSELNFHKITYFLRVPTLFQQTPAPCACAYVLCVNDVVQHRMPGELTMTLQPNDIDVESPLAAPTDFLKFSFVYQTF